MNGTVQWAAKKDLPLQKSVAAAPLHHVVMRRLGIKAMRNERETRTIFIGATPNGNAKVGGWLPFVVDLSPIYKTMHVYGTLHTNYESCTYERKGDAYYAARCNARENFAAHGDTIQEVNGCHKCWDDENARHVERTIDGLRCANCRRQLRCDTSA